MASSTVLLVPQTGRPDLQSQQQIKMPELIAHTYICGAGERGLEETPRLSSQLDLWN